MNIRPANHQDKEQLALLNSEVHRVHVRLYPSVFREASLEAMSEMVQQNLDDDSTTILVAEEESLLIGYMVLRKQIRPENALMRERSRGFIEQVCVSEEYRHRGVFRKLLGSAKKLVKEWGLDRIELDVWSHNQAAKDVFTHSGFRAYNEKMAIRI